MTCCELFDALTKFIFPYVLKPFLRTWTSLPFPYASPARLPRGRGFQGQGGDFIVNGNNVLEGVESCVRELHVEYLLPCYPCDHHHQ